MSDKAQQQQRRQREAAYREAERIRILLRQNGGRDYDSQREDDHYEGGFKVSVGEGGRPHLVGGFHYDPFRVWPPLMRQHAETLTAHGYQVKVVSHYDDGEILEVTPPPPRPRGAWLRRLFGGRAPGE